jgi:hypothetical protein
MTARFDAIAGVFPRWKVTPDLARLCETQFAKFSAEQVRLAAGQHRLERKGDDPDLGGLLSRLKGTGTRHAVQAMDAKAQLEAYNNRPNTPEDDRWDQLCDSWRADLRTAKAQPGFTPDGWARTAYPLFRRDIAEFGHTSKTFATAYLVKLARDCGVRLQIKGNSEANALVQLTESGAA